MRVCVRVRVSFNAYGDAFKNFDIKKIEPINWLRATTNFSLPWVTLPRQKAPSIPKSCSSP